SQQPDYEGGRMNFQQEIEDLKRRLAQIEATPKVKPYLDGGQWPRPISIMDGIVVPPDPAQAAVKISPELAAAEKAVESAQQKYDEAKERMVRSSISKHKHNPQYVYDGETDARVDVQRD